MLKSINKISRDASSIKAENLSNVL